MTLHSINASVWRAVVMTAALLPTGAAQASGFGESGSFPNPGVLS